MSWALETMDNNGSYLTERPPCAPGFNPHTHLCSEGQKSSVFNCPEAQGSNPDRPTLWSVVNDSTSLILSLLFCEMRMQE